MAIFELLGSSIATFPIPRAWKVRPSAAFIAWEIGLKELNLFLSAQKWLEAPESMIAPRLIAGTEYSAVATSSNVDVQVTVNANSLSEESGIESAMFADGPCLEPFDPLFW